MPSQRKKLTAELIRNMPYAESGEPAYIVRDAARRNLFVLVGARTKTFTVQRDIKDRTGKRVTVRRSLGRFEDGVSVDQARKDADATLVEIQASDGEGPPAPALTLREAWTNFRDGNARRGPRTGRARAPKTTQRYEAIMRIGYLDDWLDLPLKSISRKDAREKHADLTKRIAAGEFLGQGKKPPRTPKPNAGKPQADDVLRLFRAVHAHAAIEDETLPRDVCASVNWWRIKAERSAIPAKKLTVWYAGVQKIANPVRRDLLLFILHTGMRRQSAAEVRWADVDFRNKQLKVPKPKGGTERAFDLPLSDYLVKLLKQRQKENPELVEQLLIPHDATEWVFPAFSASGHVEEPRETIDGVPHTIHDLRRTFATVAEALDFSPYVIGALLNHRQPSGSVTAGYVSHDVDRLREPMQKISAQLQQLCGDLPSQQISGKLCASTNATPAAP